MKATKDQVGEVRPPATLLWQRPLEKEQRMCGSQVEAPYWGANVLLQVVPPAAL